MEGWIQTHSGRAFDPLNPDPKQLVIEDIAHALSHVNRYTGHTYSPCSVGRHSLAAMKLVELRGFNATAQLHALLHDATEAYLGDIAAPVKQSPIFDGYRAAEKKLEAVIMDRFLPKPEAVIWPADLTASYALRAFGKATKEADWDMLLAERNEVLPPGAWEKTNPPQDAINAYWWAAKMAQTPEETRSEFLEAFHRLGGVR